MSAPGTKNMAIGGLVCIAGIVITVVTASAASGGGRYVVAWGAILFGAVQFVFGLIAYQNHAAMPPADKVLADVKDGPRALIVALAGAVRNPDAPTAAETAAIHAVLRQVLKVTVRDSILLDVAKAMKDDPNGVAGYLKAKNTEFDAEFRMTILRGCCAVMMADPTRNDAIPALVAIGEALGITEAQVFEMGRSMAGDRDGKSLEVSLTLQPDEARDGKRLRFTYQALNVCPTCGGNGCAACRAAGRVRGDRTLTIDVPPGMKDGEKLKCSGEGDKPMSGGDPGDLFIRIAVAPQQA